MRYCRFRHQLTQLSQLPATSKFVGIVAGLNANADVESSGGDTTSKSLLGFTVADVVLEVKEDVPRPPWVNILYEHVTSTDIIRR